MINKSSQTSIQTPVTQLSQAQSEFIQGQLKNLAQMNLQEIQQWACGLLTQVEVGNNTIARYMQIGGVELRQEVFSGSRLSIPANAVKLVFPGT